MNVLGLLAVAAAILRRALELVRVRQEARDAAGAIEIALAELERVTSSGSPTARQLESFRVEKLW